MSELYASTYASRYSGPINPSPDFDKFEDLIILYNYIPSLAFNVFAAVVWGILMIIHLYWTRKRGTRLVQGLIAFGALWECILYALRAVNNDLIYRADLFFAQYAINQATPFLFYGAIHNAIDNLLLDRKHVIPLLPLPKIWIYILSTYNVVVAIITIIGASVLGHGYARVATNMEQGSADYVVIGNAVLRTGLGNELALLTITQGMNTWLIIAAWRSRNTKRVALNFTTLTTLFLTNGMLWTRTIFRLAERIEGVFGVAWSSETLFGIFEFAPVWVAVVIWAVYRIGRHDEEQSDGNVVKHTDSVV